MKDGRKEEGERTKGEERMAKEGNMGRKVEVEGI
jgi:hypothetical protein